MREDMQIKCRRYKCDELSKNNGYCQPHAYEIQKKYRETPSGIETMRRQLDDKNLKRNLVRGTADIFVTVRDQNNKCKICTVSGLDIRKTAATNLVFANNLKDLICRPCSREVRYILPKLTTIKLVINYLDNK